MVPSKETLSVACVCLHEKIWGYRDNVRGNVEKTETVISGDSSSDIRAALFRRHVINASHFSRKQSRIYVCIWMTGTLCCAPKLTHCNWLYYNKKKFAKCSLDMLAL